MSPFSITITNIKPYLVDFLLGQYAEYVEKGKLVASLNIYPGQIIHELLMPPPPGNKITLPEGGNSITFILPFYERIDIRSRNYISENSQSIFRKKIRAHFKFILVDYLERAIKKNIDLVNAVDRFMEIKNINPNNITAGALLKDFYRFRQNENKDGLLNIAPKKHYLEYV